MNNSNMMNRMLSNWLGLGVNHMDVMKFGKAFHAIDVARAIRSDKNKLQIGKVRDLSVQLALVSAIAVVMPAYAAD